MTGPIPRTSGRARTRPERRASVSSLKRRCADLRTFVAARFSADELDAYLPGHAENPHTGLAGWVEYFSQLKVFAARAGGNEERAGGLLSADAIDQATREVVLAKSLAKEPVQVRLLSGAWMTVYPKGYHAARWLESNDAQIRYATSVALAYPDELHVAALAPLVESLHVRLWAWTITTEGEDLPFDERQAADDLDPPAWTRGLAGEDLLALSQAWVIVQHLRPALCASFFPAEEGAKTRLPIAGFVGAVAHEMGRPASDLMRRWSVGELFAQAAAAAASAREARAQAERDAKTRA